MRYILMHCFHWHTQTHAMLKMAYYHTTITIYAISIMYTVHSILYAWNTRITYYICQNLSAYYICSYYYTTPISVCNVYTVNSILIFCMHVPDICWNLMYASEDTAWDIVSHNATRSMSVESRSTRCVTETSPVKTSPSAKDHRN